MGDERVGGEAEPARPLNKNQQRLWGLARFVAVSYTHLTLPTIYSV